MAFFDLGKEDNACLPVLTFKISMAVAIFEFFLILQRDFVLLRDFGYYYETLPLRRFEVRRCSCERVRLV